MADVLFQPTKFGDGEIYYDEFGDLEKDGGLETAVFISLFSDARASLDDELSDNTKDRRGWFGDGIDADGDSMGSKLWLLDRSKTLKEVISRSATYAREALEWLLVDGIASKVNVTSSRAGANQDWLILEIDIQKPNGTTEIFKYEYNWKNQELRRAIS
jgi:phage gp46-like protein